MKFEIDMKGAVADQEPTLRLSLVSNRCGNIDLIGEDQNGEVWILVTLNKDGTISRQENLNLDGIQVDGVGRILVRYD